MVLSIYRKKRISPLLRQTQTKQPLSTRRQRFPTRKKGLTQKTRLLPSRHFLLFLSRKVISCSTESTVYGKKEDIFSGFFFQETKMRTEANPESKEKRKKQPFMGWGDTFPYFSCLPPNTSQKYIYFLFKKDNISPWLPLRQLVDPLNPLHLAVALKGVPGQQHLGSRIWNSNFLKIFILLFE